jgi:hypothetical protein
MNLKDQIFSHPEKTWIILTAKPEKLKFSELIGTIDFYNHQHLTKAFKNKKLNLDQGEKTLIASNHLLPAERMIVFGLGTKGDLDKSEAQSLIKEIGNTLTELGDEDPFVAVSAQASEELVKALEKKFSSVLVG